MVNIRSPSNLELLLHCYYSPEPHPRYGADAIQEGISYLLANEMIYKVGPALYRATAKAEFFIKHLMTIPFPVSLWIIPEGKK